MFSSRRSRSPSPCPSSSAPIHTSSRPLTPLESSPSKPAYHIARSSQKAAFILLASLAGSLSPLSSNIYLPALSAVSTSLSISPASAALTVTAYMLAQGLSPPLMSPVADICGRRPALLGGLVVFAAADLGLAMGGGKGNGGFGLLMGLRALQAAGSSVMIGVSTGVVADVVDSGERGGWMGVNAGIRMSGQALGPIIGGALTAAWGFRSIFWLLFVFSIIILLAMVIILPETQRSIAGNGSVPLQGPIYVPLAYMIRKPRAWRNHDVDTDQQQASRPRKQPMTFKSAYSPLLSVFEKDVAVLLGWGAVAYTAWSMVTSSTTQTLLNSFPDLKSWELGLCFLPNGIGCVVGSLCTGRLMDMSFRSAEAHYRKSKGISDLDQNVKDKADFPMVRARLRLMPLCSAMLVACLVLYGPSFELNDAWRYNRANLAAPLALQFLIAFSAMAIFNMNSTLLVDCFPSRAATATALNNLCRCLLGAAGVAAVQPLIDAVKPTKAFAIIASMLLASSLLVWIEWKWGEQWKREREDKTSRD